jgi:hypothetical protein
MMTGNSNIPYICYFQLSCFAKENTKQSDHAGRAAASIIYLSHAILNRGKWGKMTKWVR